MVRLEFLGLTLLKFKNQLRRCYQSYGETIAPAVLDRNETSFNDQCFTSKKLFNLSSDNY